MTTHRLKIWPEYFRAVVSGAKTFELRKNDRGFAPGDTLELQEWCPAKKDYTGFVATREISYVLTGPLPGLEADYSILALEPLP